MAIHHAQARKAEKLGFTLTEDGGFVIAHWPKYNKSVYGVSGTEAIAQMEAMQAIYSLNDTLITERHPEQPRLVFFWNGDRTACLAGKAMTPHEALHLLKGDAEWVGMEAPEPVAEDAAPAVPEATDDQPTGQPVERSESGIPLDGAVAYAEGVMAGDCPFDEGTDEAEAWWEAWDKAADEAEPDEEAKGGSVVAERYRAKYAELGHPTHCGDWLAEVLNNMVLHDKGTDLERFEAICAMNGVDTSKYKREGIGWQGRLRMTGRNLLAKKVYMAGGVLKAFDANGNEAEYRAPAEWMTAQRYKMPKAQQDKPIPQAAE